MAVPTLITVRHQGTPLAADGLWQIGDRQLLAVADHATVFPTMDAAQGWVNLGSYSSTHNRTTYFRRILDATNVSVGSIAPNNSGAIRMMGLWTFRGAGALTLEGGGTGLVHPSRAVPANSLLLRITGDSESNGASSPPVKTIASDAALLNRSGYSLAGQTTSGQFTWYDGLTGGIDPTAAGATAPARTSVQSHVVYPTWADIMVRESAPASGSFAAAIAAQSPLAYYRLNEIQNNAVGNSPPLDSSGNARHMGSWTSALTGGGPLAVGDSTAGSAWFNAHRAFIPYAAWMNTLSFTSIALIKPDTFGGIQRSIVQQDDNGGDIRWRFFLQGDGTLTAYTYSSPISGGGYQIRVIAAPTPLTVGNTYIVGLRHTDGVKVELFINGVVVATTTGDWRLRAAAVPPLAIGALTGGFGSSQAPYIGRLADVAYFGTALSDATMLSLYQSAFGIAPPVTDYYGWGMKIA